MTRECMEWTEPASIEESKLEAHRINSETAAKRVLQSTRKWSLWLLTPGLMMALWISPDRAKAAPALLGMWLWFWWLFPFFSRFMLIRQRPGLAHWRIDDLGVHRKDSMGEIFFPWIRIGAFKVSPHSVSSTVWVLTFEVVAPLDSTECQMYFDSQDLDSRCLLESFAEMSKPAVPRWKRIWFGKHITEAVRRRLREGTTGNDETEG